MKRLILLAVLAAFALSGCAQLQNGSAEGGATGVEQQSPFPTRFKNDHYYQP